MNGVLARFLERPRSHLIAAWVVSIALIVGLFWTYAYGALRDKAAALEERRGDLIAQIATEKRLALHLDEYRVEVRGLDVQLRAALAELPDKKEIPDLLKTVSALAVQAGLEEGLFRPVPEVFRDFYAEVPVSIAVTGRFHQVASFFDAVGRMPRIVNINQIVIKEPDVQDEGVRIKAECTATTFRYLDEAEIAARKALAAEEGKKRRR